MYEPEGGMLIAYAAKAGQFALDGSGQNSPFVTSLAKRILEPGLEINMVFRAVRDDVLAATAKQQEPFVYGSLPNEAFYFRTVAVHNQPGQVQPNPLILQPEVTPNTKPAFLPKARPAPKPVSPQRKPTVSSMTKNKTGIPRSCFVFGGRTHCE